MPDAVRSPAFGGIILVLVALGCAAGGDDAGPGSATGAGVTDAGHVTGENRLSLVITSSEWSVPVEATRNPGGVTVFGAEIAGSFLRLWGTSPDGVWIDINIDTAAAPIPGAVLMDAPGSNAWILAKLDDEFGRGAAGGYATRKGSGAVAVDSCPTGGGDRITATFEAVRLEPLNSGSPLLTMSGSLSLLVLKAAGQLACASR